MTPRANIGQYTVHCDGQARTLAWCVTNNAIEETVARFHTYGEALAHAITLNKRK